MPAHALHIPPPTAPPPPTPPVDAHLRVLRRAAARARILPHDDLFRACALIGAERGEAAAERCALILFQVLPSALGGSRIKTFEPDARDISFDEAWLMSSLAAASRHDHASLTFLMARRLPKYARRQVAYVFQILSRHLDTAGDLRSM